MATTAILEFSMAKNLRYTLFSPKERNGTKSERFEEVDIFRKFKMAATGARYRKACANSNWRKKASIITKCVVCVVWTTKRNPIVFGPDRIKHHFDFAENVNFLESLRFGSIAFLG